MVLPRFKNNLINKSTCWHTYKTEELTFQNEDLFNEGIDLMSVYQIRKKECKIYSWEYGLLNAT